MASVTYENISKIFKTKQGVARAVVDFNLDIADREFVVLVGPSGCGKTTTLRLLAGLEEPTEGTVRIGSRVVNNVQPKDRDIAMVFQNYALYPHMNVYNNMAFGLKMRKMPRREVRTKVEETAGMLGIGHLLGRKPKALSGGERQRVALGRAIVRRPQVFLFDEPLSNLDAKLRTRMRTEIKILQRKLATTSVYVTHDQEEAMTLGSRLVIMKNGVMQQVGTPIGVYRQPANRFVAGFFGSPPMNFLEGQLESQDGELYCVMPGSRLAIPKSKVGSLKSLTGREVVIGVRAEHLSIDTLDTESDGDTSSMDMTVQTVEPLGDRQYIHMRTRSEDEIVACAGPFVEAKSGQKVRVAFDSFGLHVFEPGELGSCVA